MAAFEFTPSGIVPLDGARPVDDAAVAPGTVVATRAALATAQESMGHQVPTPRQGPKAPKPLRPMDVVKMARARLSDVNREIARLHKLEKERDELRRLLDAAENKPRAIVRDIAAAKRG